MKVSSFLAVGALVFASILSVSCKHKDEVWLEALQIQSRVTSQLKVLNQLLAEMPEESVDARVVAWVARIDGLNRFLSDAPGTLDRADLLATQDTDGLIFASVMAAAQKQEDLLHSILIATGGLHAQGAPFRDAVSDTYRFVRALRLKLEEADRRLNAELPSPRSVGVITAQLDLLASAGGMSELAYAAKAQPGEVTADVTCVAEGRQPEVAVAFRDLGTGTVTAGSRASRSAKTALRLTAPTRLAVLVGSPDSPSLTPASCGFQITYAAIRPEKVSAVVPPQRARQALERMARQLKLHANAIEAAKRALGELQPLDRAGLAVQDGLLFAERLVNESRVILTKAQSGLLAGKTLRGLRVWAKMTARESSELQDALARIGSERHVRGARWLAKVLRRMTETREDLLSTLD